MSDINKSNNSENFKILVQSCIEAFGKFFDDALSLDYNKITDTKLRALILQDQEYQAETKYLRAQKAMDDITELNSLVDLAASMGEYDDDWNPRDMGKGKGKKPSTADKDVLTMRFRAATERRELLKSLSREDTNELDALNMFAIFTDRDTYEKIETVEIITGSTDDEEVLESITGKKIQEVLPQGSNVSNSSNPISSDPSFLYDDDGDIVGIDEDEDTSDENLEAYR